MNKENFEIAKRLREARIIAGYKSAKAFSQEYCIPYITYSQHENGKRGINSATLLSYAKYLSVSAAWLLSGKDINDISSQPTHHDKSIIDTDELLGIYEQALKISNLMKVAISPKICLQISIAVYNEMIQNQNSGYGIFKLISESLIQAEKTAEKKYYDKKAG